jgi:tRNA(Ile)-lysidine synthase
MAPSKKATDLTESVKTVISAYRMIEPGSRVVVGVSGGPDSIALMHVLRSLSAQLGFRMIVAHLDHVLRPESAEDARFTAAAAAELGLQCRVKSVEVRVLASERSVSVEEAGRHARYEFFAALAEEFDAAKIATAHHMDDEIETFFLRVFRGSSIQGLQGIRPVRHGIIRPFIRTTRTEVSDFLNEQKISYRSDPTNLEATTDRNFIRNRVLPCIRERFPNFRKPLERTMELILQEEDFIAPHAEQLYKEAVAPSETGLSVNVARLRGAHSVLVSRVILSAVYEIAGPHIRVGRVHVDSVARLVYAEKPSGSVILPSNLIVRRSYDNLLISREQPETERGVTQIEVTGPGVYEFPRAGISIAIRLAAKETLDPYAADGARRAVFDAEAVRFPLILRSLMPGDRFNPWGMEGSSKIKKIYIDLKIPREKRNLIPLLVMDGEILWIAGVRRGRGAPVTDSTVQTLEIEIV